MIDPQARPAPYIKLMVFVAAPRAPLFAVLFTLVLVSIGFSLWVTLMFPTWVLAVSVYILNLRDQPLETMGERGAA